MIVLFSTEMYFKKNLWDLKDSSVLGKLRKIQIEKISGYKLN